MKPISDTAVDIMRYVVTTYGIRKRLSLNKALILLIHLSRLYSD